jgi:hypothetical protein
LAYAGCYDPTLAVHANTKRIAVQMSVEDTNGEAEGKPGISLGRLLRSHISRAHYGASAKNESA